jgi:putative protease
LLYVPIHILAADEELCRTLVKRGPLAAVLPRIAHDKEVTKLREAMATVREWGVKDVLVGNLGLLLPAREEGMRIRGDFGLNIYNSGSLSVLKKLDFVSAMLSFEMTMPQIRDVSKIVPCEMLVYGRMPLMVTEHCLIKNRTGECNCHLGTMKLTDKTGAEFPVIKDGNSCRSVLLNGKKLSWLDRQEDLARVGVWATRLYFTTENNQEVDRVLSDYVHPNPFDPGACTRGLYLRGLD